MSSFVHLTLFLRTAGFLFSFDFRLLRSTLPIQLWVTAATAIKTGRLVMFSASILSLALVVVRHIWSPISLVTTADLGLRWVAKRWKTCVDLRANLAKRHASWTQVENLGRLAFTCESVWPGLYDRGKRRSKSKADTNVISKLKRSRTKITNSNQVPISLLAGVLGI